MASIKRGKGTNRRVHKTGSTKNSPGPTSDATSLSGLIDTALDHKLQKYLKKYEDKFPTALTDALVFCEEHNLFARTDLTPEVQELVARVKFLETARSGPKRKQRRPKGQRKPVREAKGHPADIDKHRERFEAIDEYRERTAKAGKRVSLSAACREVAKTYKPSISSDALEKSYRLVESGDLHRGYYTPDYD